MKDRQLSPEKKKVARTFLLLFLPVVLILGLTLGSFTIQAINKDMLALKDGSHFHLQAGARAVRRQMTTVVADLVFLSQDPDLQNYIAHGERKSLQKASLALQRLSRTKGLYHHVRYINKKGMEEIRINYDYGLHTLVSPDKLQDKSQRYYFSDTFNLHREQIFISPLDLNIEHGQLEEPYAPMIRFGLPIFDNKGIKQGIIMLNYYGRQLLEQFREAIHSATTTGALHSHFLGEAMFLNSDGYWLLNPSKKDEWGFMLGKKTTMGRQYPLAWKEIQSKNSGDIVTPGGFFSFATIYPLRPHQLSSSGSHSASRPSDQKLLTPDYKWKLVTHIPPGKLKAINSLTKRFPWFLYTCLLIIAAPLFLAFSWSRCRQQLIEKNLRDQEQLYRLLYQLAPMAYQSLNEEGIILDINDQWLQSLGYEEHEVKGHPLTDFILPEQRDEFRTQFAEFKGRGRLINLMLRLCHKDGTIILGSFNGSIVNDEDGNFLRTQSVFQDITSQHHAHAELAGNLALLETIINTLPSIICLKDNKGRWILANNLYLDICGLADHNYQGKTDSELAWHSTRLHEELLSAKMADAKAWEERAPLRSEKTITLPEGRGEAVFDITRVPSFSDGMPKNLLMVGFDITDRKKNETTVRLNQLRFKALCQLHRMEGQSMTDLHAYALKTAGELSESKIGYLQSFETPEEAASFTTWSVSGPIACEDNEHGGHNPEAEAIWQECLTSRQVVIHNNYSSLEKSHGLPMGHLPIIHHMNAPLLDGDSITGVLGVANKEKPYNEEDAEQLSIFAANIVSIFKQRRFSLALEQSQEEWLHTFDAISDVVTIQDGNMQINQINRAGCNILNSNRKELIGKKCYEVFHGSASPCPGCPIEQDLKSFASYSGEVHHKKLAKTFLVSASAIKDEQGRTTGVAHFAKDITATKQLEEQLRQAQKMEAVGTLAGGVAHDFNNILTAISGFLELAMMKIDVDDSASADLNEVKKAADRAADLVRQLLIFSRKKPMRQVDIDINETMHGVLKMLERLIAEDIKIVTEMGQDIWQIQGDVGNIEQVLMNLTLNARDAMPDGGAITIHTENRVLSDQHLPTGSTLKPGNYIMISVKDNGVGMDDTIRDHVFEPFFSTKETSQGTGLGLAVAYGIIKDHKGWLEVDSSLGEGSVFRVFLPAISEAEKQAAGPEKKGVSLAQIKGHGERILLVEDEVMLNEFAFKALSRHGYQVSAIYDAEEALVIWDKEGANFDLLFSDVVLPGKTGIQLAEELSSRKPELKILLTSGYTDKKSQAPLIKEKGIPFLPKPYDIMTLLKKTKEVLASTQST